MDNSRPKYKKLDRFFWGEYKIFFFGGGEEGIFPLWMSSINIAWTYLDLAYFVTFLVKLWCREIC